MIDYSQKVYVEPYIVPGGGFRFKVYHYDPSGMEEIVMERSNEVYHDRNECVDAAYDWAEDNNPSAEVVI